MEKQAPPLSRVLVAIGFALSCFGLLLFLWVSFGGPVPLKSKGYRFTADFPEAFTLPTEADVRIGGVSVGKVKSLALAPPGSRPGGEATRAEIEIEPEFAPINSDAKAILRLKTLIGETYVELTSGTDGGPVSMGENAAGESAGADPIPEDGHLASARIADQTQVDEIFNALDPETRRSFQRWQAGAAEAVRNRGLDLNDALGNLDPFLFDASELLEILDEERPHLQGLVRDAGVVFEALSASEKDLSGVITNANDVFGALARRDDALAQSIAALPSFQRESRATLVRLEQFRAGAEELVDELIPVARDLSPTIRSAEQLAPPLQRVFASSDRLIDVSHDGLPALTGTLDELGPVLAELDPYLANLNPVIRYLHAFKRMIPDFFANPPSGIAGTLPVRPGQPAPRHILRQLSYNSGETLAIHPERLATNRGHGYAPPFALGRPRAVVAGGPETFDCQNTDYTPAGADPDEDEAIYGRPSAADVNGGAGVTDGFASCRVASTGDELGYGGRFPQIQRDR